MKKGTFIFLSVFMLVCSLIASCSIFAPVAEKVGDAVTRYCGEAYAERQLIRQSVNAATAPNQIKIWCNGDPDTPLFPTTGKTDIMHERYIVADLLHNIQFPYIKVIRTDKETGASCNTC